jgi:RND family efflux transporter MFP subunit
VKTTQAAARDITANIDTSGPLFAWQEVAIGSEVTGYRVQDVLVDVGDSVKKGQTLARLDSTVLQADRDQAAAQVAEAEATVKEAKANADRAAVLLKRGAISAQEADQQITSAATAAARAQNAKAQLVTAQQRLKYGQIIAPDDGVISARSVAPGQIAASATDLFKLIRRHRVEWRAEIPEAQFGKVRKGMLAQVKRADGTIARGRVRALSPNLDPSTHRGIAYVDLTLEPALSPGMYVTGSIALGESKALTLPLDAVMMRDGFSYVFVVGANNVVTQKRITVGRVMADALEVNDGVSETDQIVYSGAGFLHDGDHVAVANTPAAGAAS